jgi:undecaprenyl-phosphate 4-deoxy-4-formamido-L-arabinose transferase
LPLQISVVIPVYKAEACLHELYRRLRAALETITTDFEIILVEDCGGDRSWEIIQKLAQVDPRVKGMQLSRNFGQHAATICGFAQSQGHWVVTLDDDLEQSPEDIPALLAKAEQGYALVYGVYPQRAHVFWRNMTSALARYLFKKAIPQLNDVYTSFRLIDGELAREVCRFESPFSFVDGYLSWLTSNCASVEVGHSARAHGGSNYTFRKLLVHTINIFVTFSDLPLRLASWVGLGSFLIGMFWLCYLLLMKLFGGITASGFTSLMAGIVLFGGIQLFVLGIFGEYLSRINFKTSRKPLYLLARETGKLRGGSE